MIHKGNRQQGSPFWIADKNSCRLERIQLNEKAFQENWLQKIIHENPQVLPIDNIESSFAPLISLGREIPTSVGFIDNLFISPDGYITLVETKLWRNPEAKREVVGQIIDYAKEFTSWSFSDLDKVVRQYQQFTHKLSKGIIDLIKEHEMVEDYQEQIIIDNIERNLKRGRLLLLIVGDGIRESVEEMVDYLSNSPQIHFTLGLVELQVYKNPANESEKIVIPNLITRTREITRAVVRIENNSNNNVVVQTDFVEEKAEIRKNKRYTLTADDFFDQLQTNTNYDTVLFAQQILNSAQEKGYCIDWGQSSFIVRLFDPNGSKTKITLYVINRSGEIYIGWSGWQLKSLGIDELISHEFAQKTAKLFPNIKVNPKERFSWDKHANLYNLKSVYKCFINEVDCFVEEIIKQSKSVAYNE